MDTTHDWYYENVMIEYVQDPNVMRSTETREIPGRVGFFYYKDYSIGLRLQTIFGNNAWLDLPAWWHMCGHEED